MNIQNRYLRLLGAVDLLKETIDIYRSNFVMLAGISASICGPFSVLAGILLALWKSEWDPYSCIGLWVSITLLVGLLVPVCTGVIISAVYRNHSEQDRSISSFYKRVFSVKRLFTLAESMIALACVIGGVLFVSYMMIGFYIIMVDWPLMISVSDNMLWLEPFITLPAFIAVFVFILRLILRYALVTPILFAESAGPIEALRRSRLIMNRQHTGRTFFLFITHLILITPVFFVMLNEFGKNAYVRVLCTILIAISLTLIMPVISISLAQLYNDIRVRKEGLGIIAEEL